MILKSGTGAGPAQRPTFALEGGSSSATARFGNGNHGTYLVNFESRLFKFSNAFSTIGDRNALSLAKRGFVTTCNVGVDLDICTTLLKSTSISTWEKTVVAVAYHITRIVGSRASNIVDFVLAYSLPTALAASTMSARGEKGETSARDQYKT